MMTETASQHRTDFQDRGGIRPGLSRVRELLCLLGNPQEKLRYVHAAGSNGKGSACAMAEAVLRKAGYRTGLYTSPYLLRPNEEIRICGRQIPDKDLDALTERISREAEKMTDPPSPFERTTAAALLYFYLSGCDIVILETGMGGLLDATNVIPAPDVCMILNIGMDHTKYLGNTPEEIAAHKAGIIKPGTRTVCYDLPQNVRQVIAQACQMNGAALRYADFGKLETVCLTECGQKFRYRDRTYTLNLCGTYQIRNAAVVLEAIGALRDAGWNIPEEAVWEGLSSVSWPARFEVLHKEPLMILDGGHNPQCAQAFAESLMAYGGGKKWLVAAGMLRDKDYERVLEILKPHAERFYCLTPRSARALPGAELARTLRQTGAKAAAYESIAEGLQAARGELREEAGIAVFGSLYLAGPVREILRGI